MRSEVDPPYPPGVTNRREDIHTYLERVIGNKIEKTLVDSQEHLTG